MKPDYELRRRWTCNILGPAFTAAGVYLLWISFQPFIGAANETGLIVFPMRALTLPFALSSIFFGIALLAYPHRKRVITLLCVALGTFMLLPFYAVGVHVFVPSWMAKQEYKGCPTFEIRLRRSHHGMYTAWWREDPAACPNPQGYTSIPVVLDR